MATGFSEWFVATHTLTVTLDPVNTPHVVIDYSGPLGSFSGPLSDLPTEFRDAYPFDGDGFLEGGYDYHADFQRDFHIGDGTPEDPDTLSPYIPSDTGSGASECAWEWARHSHNHSDFWDNTCHTDYATTSSTATDLATSQPLATAIAYYGNPYNAFTAQFGDVGWDWNAVVLGLGFNTAFAAGEMLISSLAPATAIALEWDDTEPAVTFLDGDWSFTQSGDYLLRAFKRRVSFHDSGGAPATGNETGAPWWPGFDGTAPVPATEFASGSSFDTADLALLSDGANEIWQLIHTEDSDLVNNRLEFAFVPNDIVDDNFPAIEGVGTYSAGAQVDTVTFHFTYQTRPFRWSYRLPPEQGPGDIRRRWAIGKR